MSIRHITTISLLLLLMMGFVLLQGCKEAEATDGSGGDGSQQSATSGDADDPVDFFIMLEEKIAENSLQSIAIIEITDPKENDIHRIRNVRQATMEQLADMLDVSVREVSRRRMTEVLGEFTGAASTGIDPEDVEDIGIQLGVDVLLFGSIESKQNDVFFWAYSTMSGEVIFSDTLRKWKLPVGGGLDAILDGLADTSDDTAEEDTEEDS